VIEYDEMKVVKGNSITSGSDSDNSWLVCFY